MPYRKPLFTKKQIQDGRNGLWYTHQGRHYASLKAEVQARLNYESSVCIFDSTACLFNVWDTCVRSSGKFEDVHQAKNFDRDFWTSFANRNLHMVCLFQF